MDPLPLLKDLVAANSVNPSLVPGAPGEAEAAEVARAGMAAAGMDVDVVQVRPGRPNVIGMLAGTSAGPTVMLCGHLDTVGVQGMVEPFTPRVRDGRLYGRGAQDMKGGIAAMIAAAGKLASTWSRGRLIVAAVVDEEHESIGATSLAREWKADAAIVTEPTDLKVAIAHKGFAWLEVVTRGRAAHGSRPKEGRDAILRMGRVLAALEAHDRHLQSRQPVELQGTGSLHASLINGGRELSSYPDSCTMQLERRMVSGEDGPQILAELESILLDLKHRDPEFDASVHVMAFRHAYQLDPAHRLVTAMREAIRRTGRDDAPGGMTFWTDAAILGESGTPSVLFGPGGAGLHSIEEYVNVDDVYACRDILVDGVLALVGR